MPCHWLNSSLSFEGTMIIQNIGNYLPNTVWYPERLDSSATLLSEPHVKQVSMYFYYKQPLYYHRHLSKYSVPLSVNSVSPFLQCKRHQSSFLKASSCNLIFHLEDLDTMSEWPISTWYCKTWGSHGGTDEDVSVLGCSDMSNGKTVTDILPLSSQSNSPWKVVNNWHAEHPRRLFEAQDTTNAEKKLHPAVRIRYVPIICTVFYTLTCVLNYTYAYNQL